LPPALPVVAVRVVVVVVVVLVDPGANLELPLGLLQPTITKRDSGTQARNRDLPTKCRTYHSLMVSRALECQQIGNF